MGLGVPESGDDLEAVVDGVAAAAALTQYLPVFEASDDVFDSGTDASVGSVVVVVDDAASLVAPGGGDRSDGAVSGVTEDDTTIQQLYHGVAGHVDYRLAHAVRAWLASQQEWEGSVNRHQPPTPHGVGSARTGSHHRLRA
jgi:hypothetical protein